MSAEKENASDVIKDVKEYYGKKLRSKLDLQTPACTTPAQKVSAYINDALKLVHDEVVTTYYGCGLVVPDCLENMKILDLGSGSGRDCYALSKLVGQDGFVTGIDMTEEQLEIANRHINYHTNAFGYQQPNVKFVKGYLENLKEAGIEDNSVDIIVSNCVINLCKDKEGVLREAYRVLGDGGELYFSDIYVDKEMSEDARNHKLLWGECVSGAMYWKQLFELAEMVGFETPRTFSLSTFTISKPELKEVVGDVKFASVVYRLFKLPKDADRTACEVIYNGTITGCEEQVKFDWHHTFKEGQPVTLDGSTSAILKQSRFKEDFMFKNASCCAKKTEVVAENPFDILESGDISVISNAGSCCSGNSACC